MSNGARDSRVPQQDVDPVEEMAAFDDLPAAVRRKVAEGPYSIAALSIVARMRGGGMTEEQCLAALDRQYAIMLNMRVIPA